MVLGLERGRNRLVLNDAFDAFYHFRGEQREGVQGAKIFLQLLHAGGSQKGATYPGIGCTPGDGQLCGRYRQFCSQLRKVLRNQELLLHDVALFEPCELFPLQPHGLIGMPQCVFPS